MSSPESLPPEDPSERVCVVGLGSECGDDRAGWQVVERLAQFLAGAPNSQVRLVRAVKPADLVDLIEPGDRLIVIDACQGAGSAGSYLRLIWPSDRLPNVRPGCGHNVSLADALKLAAALGNLSRPCEIWCLEGRRFEWEEPLSPEVFQAVTEVAAEISSRLAPG